MYSFPSQNSFPTFHHHLPFQGRGKLPIPPRPHFVENLFPPTAERLGWNYDFLYQESIKRYKDDLEPYVIYTYCMICSLSNLVALQFYD